MGRNYEICGAKPKTARTGNQWSTCNRKVGHAGQHSDSKSSPVVYWRDEPTASEGPFPCPHGCEDHTVPTQNPMDCGHHHSPTECEWGDHGQTHSAEYWAAMSAASSGTERIKPRGRTA